jgi:imidazolonepropionase-like amidohydrolase
VLLNGDNIVATGAAADQQAGQISNVTAIDATGLTVMPGLIDAHCHISFDEVNSNDELFFHRDRPAL